MFTNFILISISSGKIDHQMIFIGVTILEGVISH